MRAALAGLLAAACGAISACAGGGPARAGHLLIAGGGTSPDNELIYSRFISPLPPDALIGVIPTASADTAGSGASAAGTIARYAGARRVEVIEISVSNPDGASDPDVVRRIRACSALWFTGGVQSRITQVFRRASGDTPAYQAARDVLAAGGVIGGTSAGAAMMSDPMIAGGSSEDALNGKFRVGEGEEQDSGFSMAQGMGFFPFGLTDQHFLRRGRLGRLVIALERAGVPRGFGVEEGAAMHADLSTGVITALGQVLMVDASRLSRRDGVITGVRVSLLNAGDTVDGPSGHVAIPPTRYAPPGTTPGQGPLPAAWSRGAVTTALHGLAESPGAGELRSETWVLRLATTRETVAWKRGDQVSIAAVALELAPVGRGKP